MSHPLPHPENRTSPTTQLAFRHPKDPAAMVGIPATVAPRTPPSAARSDGMNAALRSPCSVATLRSMSLVSLGKTRTRRRGASYAESSPRHDSTRFMSSKCCFALNHSSDKRQPDAKHRAQASFPDLHHHERLHAKRHEYSASIALFLQRRLQSTPRNESSSPRPP